MNKKTIWSFLALGLVFILLAGCAGPAGPEGGEAEAETGEGETGTGESGTEKGGNEPAGPIDCGTDMECFIAAAENCEDATMVRTASLNLFGMVATATNFMEISSTSAGECVYFQRTDENTVSFSDELVASMLKANSTQEEIDAQLEESNEIAQIAVGLEMTCTTTSENIVEVLTEWNQGTSMAQLQNCEDNSAELTVVE